MQIRYHKKKINKFNGSLAHTIKWMYMYVLLLIFNTNKSIPWNMSVYNQQTEGQRDGQAYYQELTPICKSAYVGDTIWDHCIFQGNIHWLNSCKLISLLIYQNDDVYLSKATCSTKSCHCHKYVRVKILIYLVKNGILVVCQITHFFTGPTCKVLYTHSNSVILIKWFPQPAPKWSIQRYLLRFFIRNIISSEY